jgi:hypothetical protein
VPAPHDIGTQSLPGIAYAQRPDALSEAELSTLALVYRFVLDCHARDESAPEGRPDDAEGPKNDRTATEILLRPS